MWALKIFLITALFTTSSQTKIPSPICSKADRAALLGFKASIWEDTTRILSTWAGADCCGGGWEGVECGGTGRVTKLIMQRPPSSSQPLFMKGTLSHSLSNLQFLEVLLISGMKHISGKIPNSFANLTHLKQFVLDDNHLHGTIPSSLGLLTSLQTMSLSGNHLTGQIPSSLGNLRNLLHLNLAKNLLTDFLGRLSNLRHLVLTRNKFIGKIPIPLFSLSNLTELSIDQNLLIGRIPNEVGNLKSVSALRLSSNKLTGQIPDSIAHLHSLWNLNLSRNMLTNPLPNTAFGEGLPSLLSIDLSYNDLDLRAVPDWIRERELYDVQLAGCKIRGTLPNFTKPSFLTTLDLSHNYFTKGISRFFSDMTSLQTVKISNNLLTSDLSSIILPTQISVLDLHSNQLHGSLSKMLSKASKFMEVVDVSSNQISSSIPDFSSGLNIKVLNLASNKISGHIPSSVSKLAELERLDVSRNRITGTLPTTLGLLVKLLWLDLSANKLSGTIPESLLGVEALKHASFRVNRLCGKIPQGRPYNIFPAAAYAHNLCLCGKPLPPSESNYFAKISF
ncbi:Leucine-rich repeat family protein [Perilla frutescens var. frutescens]|nr:Leucine-rich repeat family protein [Perilla frutescens var. frutescens]